MNKATNEGKVIGNVGVLDLRQAGEESVAGIKSVGNVGVLLYARETARLAGRLAIGNVGSTVEAAAEAQLRTGKERISRHTLQNRQTPLQLIVSGQLIIEPDVTAEAFAQGVAELTVMGKALCPEHLAGALQEKLRHLDGRVETYSSEASLATGELVLDEAYLRRLADNSNLMVAGSLMAAEALPDDLLAQKIQRIQVSGRITCRAENKDTLLDRLAQGDSSPRLTVIPAGYKLVSRPLLLDAALLQTLPSRKLYCTEMVQIAAEVDAGMLDALEGLVVQDLLVCPASLRQAIAAKIDLLETTAIFYEGELWLLEDVTELGPARFDYLEGSATLVVRGVINLAAGLDPKLLADRLVKVHNLGVVTGAPEQIAALQARLGMQEGVFEVDGSSEREEADGGMGNIGYLRL